LTFGKKISGRKREEEEEEEEAANSAL